MRKHSKTSKYDHIDIKPCDYCLMDPGIDHMKKLRYDNICKHGYQNTEVIAVCVDPSGHCSLKQIKMRVGAYSVYPDEFATECRVQESCGPNKYADIDHCFIVYWGHVNRPTGRINEYLVRNHGREYSDAERRIRFRSCAYFVKTNYHDFHEYLAKYNKPREFRNCTNDDLIALQKHVQYELQGVLRGTIVYC